MAGLDGSGLVSFLCAVFGYAEKKFKIGTTGLINKSLHFQGAGYISLSSLFRYPQ